MEVIIGVSLMTYRHISNRRQADRSSFETGLCTAQFSSRFGRILHWIIRMRLNSALNCCDRAEQKGVQSDGQQSAGDDQALAFGWKQTKCNAELGEDKGELSNLCQTGGNDESRVEWVAEQEDDQKRRYRLAQDNDRNHC
jgi:hypothetical protein